MKVRWVAAMAAIVFGCAGAATAQESADAADWFTQSGNLELIASHNDSDGVDSLVARGGYAATVRVVDRLTLQGLATLWPIEASTTDSVFSGQAVFAEEIALHYAGDGFSFLAGKFDPVFGSAFNLAPGIYGKEIGQSYQTVEKLGVGVDADVSAMMPAALAGTHVASFSVFRSDTSELSGALGTKRPRVTVADGGAGNTTDMRSWAASLDGELASGAGYTLGVRFLPGGLADEADERGAVVGFHYTPKEPSGLSMSWVAEAVAFENASGVPGARRLNYTLGLTIDDGELRWSATVSGAAENELAGEGQRRLELSVARDLATHVVLDAGVQFVDQASDAYAIAGLRLSYAFGA